jgi:CBS domain-containing protein
MDKADLQSIMRGHFPFDLLTETEFEKITERSEYTTFSKNELLFHEDESNEDLNIYFLVAGLAKNVLHRNNGKQFSLRYYYPGDIVGLMMMLTSGKMTFSVQALEDCTALQMNQAYFF